MDSFACGGKLEAAPLKQFRHGRLISSHGMTQSLPMVCSCLFHACITLRFTNYSFNAQADVQIPICFSDGDNRVLLKQVFIGIIFMSLDGVPLIAVLNTLSGFHFSLTRFSITVIINIIKEATQNPVLLPFGSIPNVWELFFYLCIGIVLRTEVYYHTIQFPHKTRRNSYAEQNLHDSQSSQK